jgi:hypothetical protein
MDSLTSQRHQFLSLGGATIEAVHPSQVAPRFFGKYIFHDRGFPLILQSDSGDLKIVSARVANRVEE